MPHFHVNYNRISRSQPVFACLYTKNSSLSGSLQRNPQTAPEAFGSQQSERRKALCQKSPETVSLGEVLCDPSGPFGPLQSRLLRSWSVKPHGMGSAVGARLLLWKKLCACYLGTCGSLCSHGTGSTWSRAILPGLRRNWRGHWMGPQLKRGSVMHLEVGLEEVHRRSLFCGNASELNKFIGHQEGRYLSHCLLAGTQYLIPTI